MSGELAFDVTPDELAESQRLDTIIAEGIVDFLEVGEALARFTESKLQRFFDVLDALLRFRQGRRYRHLGFGTWDDYCRDKIGHGKDHINRLIVAAQVSSDLMPIGIIPRSESQARPLVRLEPDQRREAWQLAVESSPNGQPTAREVEAAAEIVAPRPARQEPEPPPTLLFTDPVEDDDDGAEDDAEAEDSAAPAAAGNAAAAPAKSSVKAPRVYYCKACQEPFDQEVWHCPGCDHHWQVDDRECRNCHDFALNDSDAVERIRHGPGFTMGWRSSDWPTLAQQPTLYACDVCGKILNVQAWHCARCNHHWPPHVEECRNCGSSERATPPSAKPPRQVNGEEDREIADKKRGDAWIKAFHDLFVTVNSIRDHGGFARLIRGWTVAQKEGAVVALTRIRDLLDEYLSLLQER
jgi:hypothetical protein